MELRTVNTFLHIAELHSFSRTARQLGYSQSAVSSQIAQLEAELGTPLFDRVGKTVRLTDAGQTFLRYARTLLETAQQAQAALQPAQQVRGSLRIALADSVCSTFLPGLLQRYHARCPQVELVLHTASTDEMLQLLSTNQVDLVYTLDQPLLQPALVLAADVPEPVCFIAPPQHPLAQESWCVLTGAVLKRATARSITALISRAFSFSVKIMRLLPRICGRCASIVPPNVAKHVIHAEVSAAR